MPHDPEPEPAAQTLPDGLILGAGGRPTCWWHGGLADYEAYHDTEWGRPVHDDTRLFEKLCLEGFQAGLSWLTILRKRPAFRAGFADFDIPTVAGFGAADVERLLADRGIVRHRGKIEAVINNAARARDLQAEAGSLDRFLWSFAPQTPRPAPTCRADVPATTPESTALSKALKARGWRFVGPTTCYAFMQAMGMVNDHIAGCWCRDDG